jgi:hypothetical protein
VRGQRFDLPELFAFWEQLRLPYAVVTYLADPIQHRLRTGLARTGAEAAGIAVVEPQKEMPSWHGLVPPASRHRILGISPSVSSVFLTAAIAPR